MQRTPGKNSFRWPQKDDIVVYDTSDVIFYIRKAVIPINNRGDYKMDEDDYVLVNEKMKEHNTQKQ